MAQVRLNEQQLQKCIAESIKRILKEETEREIDDKIVDLISFLHNAQKPLREIHWNTRELELHSATDEAIGDLFGWEDSLAETFINNRDIKLTINENKPSSSEDFKAILNELCDLANEVRSLISDKKDYTNINAVIDEILEKSKQLLYKGELK